MVPQHQLSDGSLAICLEETKLCLLSPHSQMRCHWPAESRKEVFWGRYSLLST